MRIAKFLAAIVLPSLILAARLERAGAQLPPPNPLVVPSALPSPPQQLLAPVQPQGIPSLVVVPTTQATPAPSSNRRVFNCSCFGPGSGTHFMGEVSATSYFAARQGAVSACLSSNTNKQPEPPLVPIQSSSASSSSTTTSSGQSLPAGSTPSDEAANVGQSLPGTLNFSAAAQLRECSQCTCD
jgi:hypothetical protein